MHSRREQIERDRRPIRSAASRPRTGTQKIISFLGSQEVDMF